MATLTDQQIANAAKAGGWSSSADIATAVAIALAESGGRSDAINNKNTNGSTDYGLWQVNSVHGFPVADLMTPTGNARAAHNVYTRQGWRAWTVYKTGAYRAFLARGMKVAASASDTGGQTAEEARESGVIRDATLAETVNLAIGPLVSPDTWRRVGMFVLGACLLIFGLLKVTGDNQLSQTTKSLIATGVKVAATRKP